MEWRRSARTAERFDAGASAVNPGRETRRRRALYVRTGSPAQAKKEAYTSVTGGSTPR